MLKSRLEQSSHHQQLEEISALQKSIGEDYYNTDISFLTGFVRVRENWKSQGKSENLSRSLESQGK